MRHDAKLIAVPVREDQPVAAPWTPGREAAAGLIEQMKSLHITVMGAQRSYWDFYFGFGLSISVSLFALALLLWQMATLARASDKDRAAAAPIPLLPPVTRATLPESFLVIGFAHWLNPDTSWICLPPWYRNRNY